MNQEIPQQKLLTQWRFPAGFHTIQLNIEKDGNFTKSDVDAIIEMMTIIRRQMPDEETPIPADWVTCEYCGGSGDDGFDRCYPPNPYICGKCDGKGKVSPETAASWPAEDIMECDEFDSKNS